MVAAAAVAGAHEELPEVEVFVPGPDGEPLEVAEPVGAHEVLRELGTSLSHSLHQLGELHAAQGTRLGSAADRATRNGSREDVMTPLLLDPSRAFAAVGHGAMFDPPIPLVDIDSTSLEIDSRGISWRAVVHTGRYRRRSATLRLYSSPSANLTVIELVPDKPRWIWTWSFVRAGVAAVDELADRLAQSSARHACRVPTSVAV